MWRYSVTGKFAKCIWLFANLAQPSFPHWSHFLSVARPVRRGLTAMWSGNYLRDKYEDAGLNLA